MDQGLENKLNFKDKILNFYNLNKIKIYIILIIFILSLLSLAFINYKNDKKNVLISEKYVQAGLYLASNKKQSAKDLYEEIILSKSNFYSILALNTIVEKGLISDQLKVLEYFSLLEKSINEKETKNLLLFKKALYLIKFKDDKESGHQILKKLIDENSNLKALAQEIVEK